MSMNWSEKYCECCGREYDDTLPPGIAMEGFGLIVDGKTIQVSPRELAVFKRLLRANGKPVQKRSTFFEVWGEDSEVNWKILDVILSTLRKKLNGTRVRIETIYGFGHKLVIAQGNVVPLKRVSGL